MLFYSWNYGVINPGQDATGTKMSLPDSRRPTDDDDELDSRDEKRPVASRGTTGETLEKHRGISQDDMV